MTLIDDVHEIRSQQRIISDRLDTALTKLDRTDEQINGARGLSAAINAQTAEIQSLRRAAYWVAGIIVASSLGFAFSVLALIG